MTRSGDHWFKGLLSYPDWYVLVGLKPSKIMLHGRSIAKASQSKKAIVT